MYCFIQAVSCWIDKPAPLTEVFPRRPETVVQQQWAFAMASSVFVADGNAREKHSLRYLANTAAQVKILQVQKVSLIKEANGTEHACPHQHETTGETWNYSGFAQINSTEKKSIHPFAKQGDGQRPPQAPC
jgi:hypothetical protein